MSWCEVSFGARSAGFGMLLISPLTFLTEKKDLFYKDWTEMAYFPK